MRHHERSIRAVAPVAVQRKAAPERASATVAHPPQRALGNERYQGFLAGMRVQRDCGCGGSCASCGGTPGVDEAPVLQPKLTVGPVNDAYEREADAVADAVMRMPDADAVQRQPIGEEEEAPRQLVQAQSLQRQPLEEEEEMLQAKPLASQITPLVQRAGGIAEGQAAPSAVHDTLSTPGQSLDADTRSFMESRFQADFSRVRVHTGPAAAASAKSVQAQAYTVGGDVVFGAGAYTPGTASGKHLLAHELTHVVQQGAAG